MTNAAENRAAMPLAAALIDEIRASYPDAKVLWVKEGARELGKRPTLEPHLIEISAETFDLLRQHAEFHGKGKRRG
jgi:hypothetical protein